jgi:hypothetical protein
MTDTNGHLAKVVLVNIRLGELNPGRFIDCHLKKALKPVAR